MFRHHRPHSRVHVIGWDLGWHASRVVRRLVFGTALVLFGVGALLQGRGLISGAELWLIAPIAIALSGAARLAMSPTLVNLGRALVRLALAAYLVVVIEHIGGWTLAATWPVLLIVGGAAMVGRALFVDRARGNAGEEPNW